ADRPGRVSPALRFTRQTPRGIWRRAHADAGRGSEGLSERGLPRRRDRDSGPRRRRRPLSRAHRVQGLRRPLPRPSAPARLRRPQGQDGWRAPRPGAGDLGARRNLTMRYRPSGRSGSVVSAITLRLGDAALARGPAGARELIYAALEGGVNTFQLLSADPVLAELTGEALSAVDRKLVFVSLGLGQPEHRRGDRDFSAEGLTGAMDRALRVSGLEWIHLALLDEPGGDELAQA